ncbi:MAG: DUF6428 family protein [Xanthobacteraceae bacterium]
MLAPAKSPGLPAAHATSLAGTALSLQALRVARAPHAGKPLVFEYDGRTVQSGYHMTEVKSGWFASLDCGANPENWRETIIQLWDVPETDRAHMPVATFLAIIGKVTSELDFDPDARLTFEVSDGVSAMQLFSAVSVEEADSAVRVSLGNLPSSCKPRDRWLKNEDSPKASHCCS